MTYLNKFSILVINQNTDDCQDVLSEIINDCKNDIDEYFIEVPDDKQNWYINKLPAEHKLFTTGALKPKTMVILEGNDIKDFTNMLIKCRHYSLTCVCVTSGLRDIPVSIRHNAYYTKRSCFNI